MDTIWIFANPIAGRGRGGRIAEQLRQVLQMQGFKPQVFLERADTLSDANLIGQPRAAVVIGGDGTLGMVAQRLYRNFGPGGQPPPKSAIQNPKSKIPLLPIPLGTANLMGRHLGIHWSHRHAAEHAVAALRKMRIHSLDAATANDRLCLLMAHVGFDAHVVHELARIRRGAIRHASYVKPALVALAGYRPSRLTVQVDGHPVFHGSGMAFVANIPEYGLGFPLVPQALGDDGLLDVCCVPCRSRLEIVNLFIRAAGGTHMASEGVACVRGRQVRIEADPPAPVQIDGDPGGFTPLNVQLLPFRIPFVVP